MVIRGFIAVPSSMTRVWCACPAYTIRRGPNLNIIFMHITPLPNFGATRASLSNIFSAAETGSTLLSSLINSPVSDDDEIEQLAVASSSGVT